MTTFFLILWFQNGYRGGATSIDFTSRESCETAKAEILREYGDTGWGKYLWARCFERKP